jgi:hypothetical protein
VQGSIDDMPVDISATASGYSFANKISADPGSLHVLVPGGLFDLEFDKLTPYGGSSAARGVVQAYDTGLSVGNCESSGFPSSMHISDDGNTIVFTLVQLAHAPYCNATPARGQLQGCFATEP